MSLMKQWILQLPPCWMEGDNRLDQKGMVKKIYPSLQIKLTSLTFFTDTTEKFDVSNNLRGTSQLAALKLPLMTLRT